MHWRRVSICASKDSLGYGYSIRTKGPGWWGGEDKKKNGVRKSNIWWNIWYEGGKITFCSYKSGVRYCGRTQANIGVLVLMWNYLKVHCVGFRGIYLQKYVFFSTVAPNWWVVGPYWLACKWLTNVSNLLKKTKNFILNYSGFLAYLKCCFLL